MVNKKYNKLLNVLFCICVVLTIVSIGQIISMIIQKRVFIAFYVVSTLLIFCSLLYIIIFAYTKKAFANTLDLKQNVSARNAKTTMSTKRQNYKNYSKDELFLIWCGQNTNKVYRLNSFFNIMKKILLCVLVVVVEIAICLLLNLWKSSYDYLDTNQAIPIIVMSITFFFAIFVITEIIKDSDMSLYKDYFSVVLFDDIEKHITSHELPTKYNPNTFFVRMLKNLCNYEKIDLTKYEEKNKKIEADDLTTSHKKTNNLNSNKKNNTKNVEVDDDFKKINFLITNFLHFKSMNMSVMPITKFNNLLSEQKFSAINFEKLKKDSNDIYKLTEQQEREQNLIIQELCVPLKRSGYLDSANKVYKYIYKTYGFSQVLMNSWAKIFVCNKQFDIAYKLFELGDNQYQYRIKTGDLKVDPVTIMIFGGVPTSQCCENMKKAERAMNDHQYALQLVKDMGGNPNINNTNKLE